MLEEKNYLPRMGLSSLTNRSSKIIGVVIHIKKYYENTIIANPFYGELLGSLEKSISDSGYYMMLYTSENLNDIFEMAISWNVDGLIAISFTENDYKKIKSLTNKPIVAIDLYNETDDDFYNVGLDDEEGGYQMTKYLIHNGYKNILIIGNKNYGVDHQRFLGYTRALNEFKLPYKKENFIIFSQDKNKRIGGVYNHLIGLANKNYALFFLSDQLASDALRYLQNHNIVVPNDIGIVGFDDNLYSRLTTPQLTTVNQDVSRKAFLAIELLLKVINLEPIDNNNIILPVRIVKRDSTNKSPPSSSLD